MKIAIAGAGPAGSYLFYKLSNNNKVEFFEKKSQKPKLQLRHQQNRDQKNRPKSICIEKNGRLHPKDRKTLPAEVLKKAFNYKVKIVSVIECPVVEGLVLLG